MRTAEKRELEQARDAMVDGKPVHAARALREHLAAHPDDVDARMRLAQLLLKDGARGEAHEWLVSAAQGFATRGFLDKAVALLHRAFDLDPSRPEPALLAAELQVKRGHAGDARKTLAEARARYRGRADRANALRVAEKRALLVPDTDAWLDVARLLARAGRRAQSVAVLDERAAHATGKERKRYLRARLALHASPRSLWRWLRG